MITYADPSSEAYTTITHAGPGPLAELLDFGSELPNPIELRDYRVTYDWEETQEPEMTVRCVSG